MTDSQARHLRVWCFLLMAAAGPAAFVASNHEARADSASAMVVVVARDTAISRRVAAELVAIGLSVRMQPTPDSGPLEDAARDLHVEGVVRITGSALEVLLVEPGSGRTIVERFVLGQSEADQVTAVHRATELLRTQLLDPFMARAALSSASALPTPTLTTAMPVALHTAQTMPETMRETPALPTTPPQKLPPRAGVWIGAAVGWSGPITQGAAYFVGGAHVRVIGPFHIEATIARSLTTATVTSTAGVSDVEAWTVGLAGRLRFGNARFGAGGGLGLGGVWLLLTGHANAPYISDRADVLTLLPFAVAGLDVSPVRHFAIRADVTVGATSPRASIVFAELPVADWGVPLVLATLAAEAQW